MTQLDLQARIILVVEDEPILALDIADETGRHNGLVMGPATTLLAAEKLLSERVPDACILDIRLGSGTSYQLADQLLALGVPFLFASSEQRFNIPQRFDSVPLHAKPVNIGMLRALSSILPVTLAG